MHQRRERREQPLGGAGRDRDLGDRIVAAPVEPLVFQGERFAQRRLPRHRRVLIVTGPHVAGHARQQLRFAVEVRKALRQVDRAMLVGKPRHRRKNADAGGRELRPNGGHITTR